MMSNVTTVTIQSFSELESALADAARVCHERMFPLQQKSGGSWDYLRIEIWWDSGRVILFPASSSSDRRVDASVVQIVCDEFAKWSADLMRGALKDDEFEDQVAARLAGIASVVRRVLASRVRSEIRIFDCDKSSPIEGPTQGTTDNPGPSPRRV